MKKRQSIKVLKKASMKMYKDIPLSSVECKYLAKQSDSKLGRALHDFHNKEFEAGTIYGDGYHVRLMKVVNKVMSIESLTGVKEIKK